MYIYMQVITEVDVSKTHLHVNNRTKLCMGTSARPCRCFHSPIRKNPDMLPRILGRLQHYMIINYSHRKSYLNVSVPISQDKEKLLLIVEHTTHSGNS